MAYSITTFESDHIGVVNDTKFDYYGKRVVTCGLDGKIHIFEIVDDNAKKISEISGHNGAVWQLSWSHPEFGSLIASCGFDRKVYIWKETANNKWEKTYEYTDHKNSVNSVSFCPHEYGLILLCSSLDGSISIHEYKNENWSAVKITAHSFGVTSSTWACNDLNTSLRFISAGVDGLIKIWSTKENNFGHNINSFTIDSVLEGHEDSIKEISWKYNSEAGYEVIVSGGEDNLVYLWYSTDNWNKMELSRFESGVSSLSWDEKKEHLGVNTNDGICSLYKELEQGKWILISITNNEGFIENVKNE